jgi:hypothetical protein
VQKEPYFSHSKLDVASLLWKSRPSLGIARVIGLVGVVRCGATRLEWRQLRFLRQCKVEADPLFPDQVDHFIVIEPKLIREVIVGCRATETLIRAIRELKRLSHFGHVRFLLARMHRTDFALEFEPF